MNTYLHTTLLTLSCWAACATFTYADIYGTLSNFDVFNNTHHEAFGAELEFEGIHKEDVLNTFPSHFDHRTAIDYSDGITFGTRVTFTGYNFNADGYLAPTVGSTTNGHACVNVAGCEHFGFSLTGNPTATRYYWLDAAGQRIGSLSMNVPTPSWNYYAPAGNKPPEVEAEIEFQNPDAVWMKVFETQLDRPVKLSELMSDNPIVPHLESEVETEWELLEKGVLADNRGKVENDKEAVIRRYEFYKYTGAYTDEHEADTQWNEIGDPPANELGDFISANMVAANLVPVPVLNGDYNGDGVVNAADYTVWRNHKGSEVETELDGDKSGIVDEGDYQLWHQHYGEHLAGGAQAFGAPGNGGNSIPEPTSILLSLVAALTLIVRRPSRNF